MPFSLPSKQSLLNAVTTQINLVSPDSFIMNKLNGVANWCLQPATKLWGGHQVVVLANGASPTQTPLRLSTENRFITVTSMIILVIPGILLRIVTLWNSDVRRAFTSNPIMIDPDKIVLFNAKTTTDLKYFNYVPLQQKMLLENNSDKAIPRSNTLVPYPSENSFISSIPRHRFPFSRLLPFAINPGGFVLPNNTTPLNQTQLLPFSTTSFPQQVSSLSRTNGMPSSEIVLSNPIIDTTPTQGRMFSPVPLEVFTLSGKEYFECLRSWEENPQLSQFAITLRTDSTKIEELCNKFLKTKEGCPYEHGMRFFFEYHYKQCINAKWDITASDDSTLHAYIGYIFIMDMTAPLIGVGMSDKDECDFLQNFLNFLQNNRSTDEIKEKLGPQLVHFKKISVQYGLIIDHPFSRIVSMVLPQEMQINLELYKQVSQQLKDLSVKEYELPMVGLMRLEMLRIQHMQTMEKGSEAKDSLDSFCRDKLGIDLDKVNFNDFNETDLQEAMKDISGQTQQPPTALDKLYQLSGEEYFNCLNNNTDSEVRQFADNLLSMEGLIQLSSNMWLPVHMAHCRRALYHLYTLELPRDTVQLYNKYLLPIGKASKNTTFQKLMENVDKACYQLLLSLYEEVQKNPSVSSEEKILIACEAVAAAVHLFPNHFSQDELKKGQNIIDEKLGKNAISNEQIKQKNDEKLSEDDLLDMAIGMYDDEQKNNENLLDEMLEQVNV